MPNETGGMRRTHLRGRENILKRVLIHVGGFNLSLVMRQLLGKGTPRGLQGLSADALLILLRFWIAVLVRTEQRWGAYNQVNGWSGYAGCESAPLISSAYFLIKQGGPLRMKIQTKGARCAHNPLRNGGTQARHTQSLGPEFSISLNSWLRPMRNRIHPSQSQE